MSKWIPFENHYFECACQSADHVFRFILDPNENTSGADDAGEIFLEVQLPPNKTIFQRLWIAVKYVFGFRCRYGAWDCTLLKREDYPRIRELLDRAEAAYVAAGAER
jgi:hypothetical protein